MWSEFFGRQPWCTSRVVDVSWPKKMEEMDKFIIRAPWMENMSPFSAGCGGQWWQSDRSNSWKCQSTWHHLCEIVFVMSFLGSSRNNFFSKALKAFMWYMPAHWVLEHPVSTGFLIPLPSGSTDFAYPWENTFPSGNWSYNNQMCHGLPGSRLFANSSKG